MVGFRVGVAAVAAEVSSGCCAGYGRTMTETQLPGEIDPFIAERVVAIRDRFGLRGLQAAHDLIGTEIAIFNAAVSAEDDGDPSDH